MGKDLILGFTSASLSFIYKILAQSEISREVDPIKSNSRKIQNPIKFTVIFQKIEIVIKPQSMNQF